MIQSKVALYYKADIQEHAHILPSSVMTSLVKGLASNITGSADICKILTVFSNCLASEYLLPNETIIFSLVSAKSEFSFTTMALILIEGENATTTRKRIERYPYKTNLLSRITFESAGHVDRDCEIQCEIGSKRLAIDIAKSDEKSAQGIYKVLELLRRAQVANEHLWEISTLGMKYASEALYLLD